MKTLSEQDIENITRLADAIIVFKQQLEAGGIESEILKDAVAQYIAAIMESMGRIDKRKRYNGSLDFDFTDN